VPIVSAQDPSVTQLPPWLTIAQAADYCGVDRTEMYAKMLPTLDVRCIGVRKVYPTRRLIRIERGSLLRLRGEPETPSAQLPCLVSIKQAANHYRVSPHLIRALIAHEELDACRIGSGKQIRIDRESLLQLGRYRSGGSW
jgi:hypothetical protein